MRNLVVDRIELMFYNDIIISLLLLGITDILPANAMESVDEVKSLEEYSMEELGQWLNIDALAEEYEVEANILLEKIYADLHSEGVFSPFTNIDLGIDDSNEITPRTPPYFIQSQDSTMYLETGNPCASGVYPYVGCVAVHRVSTADKSPIFPFGSRIHYQNSSVDIDGVSYSDFDVTDTGDASFSRSIYWTDVYGGARTDAHYKMAILYGVKKVDFTWD